MKVKSTILAALLGVLVGFTAQAQETWPKVLKGSDGSTIKLYQFQPESFSNNQLKANAAISVTKAGSSDPVFGAAWIDATTSTRGQQVQIESIRINSIKLPGDVSDDAVDALQDDLEKASLDIAIPLNELETSLKLSDQQNQLSGQLSNKAPKVIYSTSPSILVVIDGEPKIQQNPEWKVDAVVNTPFTLVKTDGKYYLHGGKHWYMAPAVKGPYALTTTVPQKLNKIEELAKAKTENNKNEEAEKDENTIYKIIVSTEPAELIQSTGEAKFTPLDNSTLLYVSNSGDDIFMDVNSQDYYVLISGRWFHSKSLSGNWEYTAADKLPADFANIREGSAKDNVLASVAGTDAANDAIQQSAVPQTAKVDRSAAQADVEYDGDPRFENIDGTELGYAVNTPASVIKWRGRYYSVDNGVWFESSRATGPWAVSVERPYAVALIPPSYPVYHMKYVYIYDVTPDYVYMGYTPGYLNNFVYGPTVVYGTGYYYEPWYGSHYYARPYTWGFGVRYNPWIGWGIGHRYSSGWFGGGISVGYNPWGYWSGGWWGPRNYRPAYCWSPYRYGGGYYGRNVYNNNYRNYNVVNRNYNGNIYRNRGGIVSRDYQRPSYNNRNRDWSSNNRNNNSNRYNNNNRYNNSNRDMNPNRRDDNRGSVPGSGSARDNNGRPVREYNPSTNRSDPYNRNNRIYDNNTRNNSRTDNRGNNDNRGANENRGANDNRGNRNGGTPNPGYNNGNRSNNNVNPNTSIPSDRENRAAPANRSTPVERSTRYNNPNRAEAPNRTYQPQRSAPRSESPVRTAPRQESAPRQAPMRVERPQRSE
ncbi:MAG: hypothetical protein EOO94_01045, partial [Pedobacter sp.]